jgi:cellobiose phosphorylase
MRFIGRGKTVVDPQSHSGPLSGSEGSVLDPIVAVRHRITLDPAETVRISIISGVAETRSSCLELVDKYQDPHFGDRTFDLAWTHSHVLLRQINATERDAQLYGRLASSVIYANSSLRANPGILLQNRRNQSGLWGYTISGDLPIVLLRIADPTHIELVRRLVQAHSYWRLKGLVVDLMIWNEDQAGYRQPLNDQIMGLIASGLEADVMNRPGGILVRLAEHIAPEDRILLQTVARAVIVDSEGSLEEQLNPKTTLIEETGTEGKFVKRASFSSSSFDPPRELIFFNGYGGFTPDGREYVITATRDKMTPAPWVNVIANKWCGTVVSETGAANTWSENAHEFRLTPWSNDPVSDPSGEVIYIRDDESGHFWSPTILPCGGETPYVTRHGFGYSVYEHTEDGIRSELWVYIAIDSPIKFSVLKLQNHSGRPRRLSVFGYVEWVLGDLRSKTMMHVTTETDTESGTLYARNPYSTEFGDRVAFLDVNIASHTVSGDREEFLGRNGTNSKPAAMRRLALSGRVTPGLDPCAAIQVPLNLTENEEREVVFTLGAGHGMDEARGLAFRFRGVAAARIALEAVWQYWNQTLGVVQVETPDKSIDVLLNGWLVYQTLACRFWARSGFYQPGGAFGFRDQLQDGMALIHVEPSLVREHLLRCAAHQFREGDVQHWWHPPSGRGVRTRCSDDYLWLPLAACRYVTATGDTGVWDEPVHFIEGRAIKPEEESYYDLPVHSDAAGSLYDHCMRAVVWGLRFGEHGLPLMGSGDWNDGMNLVGQHGKGESVWLAFFLHEVLRQFSEVARTRGDMIFAERCISEMANLRESIEANGWDGEWYRRAYFDDGSPLGSALNAECQIDSISQSWAVLSGAGNAGRSLQAMSSVDNRLVQRKSNLVQLLDPPFDKSPYDPGYIKGYDPGVRENGGQYTHAAIWSAMAFAELGNSDRAWELMNMINPVHRGGSAQEIATYRVEPYVVAADVYARPPHTGRGGWTWYTGSAGWMYRLITESLLGLRLEAARLYFKPRVPSTWNSFKVRYRYGETVYHVTILQSQDVESESRIMVDGVRQAEPYLTLVDDRKDHSVVVQFHENREDPRRIPSLISVQ